MATYVGKLKENMLRTEIIYISKGKNEKKI